MSTYHDLTCPQCGTQLLAEFADAVGGEVMNVIRFVHPETLAPLPPTEVAAPTIPATPAAVAHADALGVDLSTVEGTGAPQSVPVVTTQEVPTITKADVQAAADAQTTEAEPTGEGEVH